jgi:hypothetical protein
VNDDFSDAAWRRLAESAREADAQTPVAGPAQAAQTWRTIHARITAESPLTLGERSMTRDQRDPAATTRTTAQPPFAVPAGRDAARPRAPIVAGIAALLVVALAIGVFALHPRSKASTPGQGLPPTPTDAPATELRDMIYGSAAALSATDAWAVGNGTQGQNVVGVISHFDGKSWHISQNYVFPNAQLDSISMVSADDGWAAGSQSNASGDSSVPLLVHYTQGKWVTQTLDRPATYLSQVQMLSSDDGWARGGVMGGNSFFFRYHQGVWSPAPAPVAHATATLAYSVPNSQTPPGTILLQGSQFLSDTEGWAWGNDGPQSALWHYHNGQWQMVFQTSVGAFLALGANGANDVWVVGWHGIAQALPSAQMALTASRVLTSERPLSNGGTPEMLHYDGQHWAQVPIDISVGYNFFGGATWLTSYNLFNQHQMVQGMLLNAGGAWRVTLFPQPVTSIVGLSPLVNGGALAVAATGAEGGPQDLHLLRYSNGTWEQIQ